MISSTRMTGSPNAIPCRCHYDTFEVRLRNRLIIGNRRANLRFRSLPTVSVIGKTYDLLHNT